MKSNSKRISPLLILAVLFIGVFNANSQIKEPINTEEHPLKLRSKINKDTYSSLKDNNRVSNFVSEKEKFQNNYSSFKTFSESNREKIVKGILANPSDSAYIYDWNDIIKDWMLDTRILYYYNASSVDVIEEKKAEGSNEWKKQNRSEYLYYDSNELQKLTNSFWKEATKEWVTQELEIHNSAGMTTEYYYKVWNDTTQKFIDGIREVSTYENDTNLVEDVLQEWDTIANSWVYALKVVNVFNTKGLITSSLEKIYDKDISDWVNSFYITYEYDLLDLTGKTWQYWDTAANKWVNDVNISISYNEFGKFSGHVVQVWDTLASNWGNNNKRIIGYDDLLQLVSISDQIWDTSSDGWKDSTRSSYVYTNLGDYSTYLEEVWNGSSWDNIYRETYSYNANNNLVDILLENWDTDHWVYYSTISYTYNATEEYLKSRKDEYWNPNTGTWETEFYAELGVIANALDFVEYYDKDWNDTLYKFTGGYRELYEYYGNGQSKEIIVQEWDTVNSQWVNDQKIHYYWAAAILSANPEEYDEISIYPTPFRNNLTIELNENTNGVEIKLYNIQGQKMDEYYFDKKVNTIDLSRLKNGIYFIVYEANNRKFVRKIVKQ